MDVPEIPGEAVSVRVVLTNIPDTEDEPCVFGEDIVDTSGKSEKTTSFSFDQVLTVENIQTFHPDFLQPLAKSISSGYNGSLLIGGTSRTGMTGIKIEHVIIKQVLRNLFSLISSNEIKDLFVTVSFIQFYPDDSALDLLNPKRQALKPVCHPVLGGLVEGLCEVCVCSAEEAYAHYETGRERLEACYGSVYSRCSTLFSVAVECRLHSEYVEAEFCRARLQLFSLAGGASKTDLKGVSPLVKVLDQIQSGATTSDKLLPFLLMDALTGNSRTVLLYCIPPQGLLDNETPSALILAQRLRGLVTKATVNRWCPRATEQETRANIQELRTMMMSQEDHEGENTYRLAQLTRNLQIIKDQSWEKRRERSEKMKEKIKGGQSTKNKFHLSADVNHKETPENIQYLQEKLRQEMEGHIREGKGNVEEVQERVSRIQQLREALREEMAKHGFSTDKVDLSQQSQFEYNKALERRGQIKEEHRRLIQEEVEKMERELEQEKLEGAQREMQVLARERQILALQMEALRTETQQAERDLEEQYHRHTHELHCLRDESLQIFKVFQQVSEEQRTTLEARYRSLLLEAVQDAVHLSAQNQQLQADSKELRTALGELKDTLAVRSDPMAEHHSKN